MTHGAITEPSLSRHMGTHDRKGREGKGREQEGNVRNTSKTKFSLYRAFGFGR